MITLDNSWPAAVPLPFVDYSGSVRNSTIVGPLGDGRIDRRRRFTSSFVAASVSWILTPAEYSAFRSFYETTLGNGAALFTIEVRYPKNSALSEWVAQFSTDLEIAFVDGLWAIQSALDLIRPTEVATPATKAGWVDFEVLSETSSGDSIPFETADGFLYKVKE